GPDGGTRERNDDARSRSGDGRLNGGKPATGRAGTAELEALALLAKDGTTTVAAHARSVDPAVIDTGEVSKLQIKVSGADGTTRFVRNLHGQASTGTLRLPGLLSGDQVQLQANVRGLDGNRTDVVTVTETVKRLPDLRVDMSAPNEVIASTPVVIFAALAEHNGDMGATARCELYVGGERVDHALGVWVDAGDVVTCAMSTSFESAGTYLVEVRVTPEGVDDWDASDNVAAAEIRVTAAHADFETWGSFSQHSVADTSFMEYRWYDRLADRRGEGYAEKTESSTSQWAEAHGWLPLQMTEPADLRISMSSGGRVVHAAEWTQLGVPQTCESLWDGPISFFMCPGDTGGVPGTNFSYHRISGSITYHSREYAVEWDDLTGEVDYFYHWNEEWGWDDTVPVGDDWTFDVRLSTVSGEYPATLTLPLVRSSEVTRVPYECTTVDEPYWEYEATVCTMWAFHRERITSP
ncbi:MAG TPA: hypothetical protein VEQ60_10740, partial [Longimicrobium sp.]|nr:hypothetical protein [Longimicrobium sp.]